MRIREESENILRLHKIRLFFITSIFIFIFIFIFVISLSFPSLSISTYFPISISASPLSIILDSISYLPSCHSITLCFTSYSILLPFFDLFQSLMFVPIPLHFFLFVLLPVKSNAQLSHFILQVYFQNSLFYFFYKGKWKYTLLTALPPQLLWLPKLSHRLLLAEAHSSSNNHMGLSAVHIID